MYAMQKSALPRTALRSVAPLRTSVRGYSLLPCSQASAQTPSLIKHRKRTISSTPAQNALRSYATPSKPQSRGRNFEKIENVMSTADLSVPQLQYLIQEALWRKYMIAPTTGSYELVDRSLDRFSIGLLFSKRSTRTRLAAETALNTLGAIPMFLGKEDIQLGVNESLRDSGEVIGSMLDGLIARVGGHQEIEDLATYSRVPVVNALSDLWHPTQILADLMTLYEIYTPKSPFEANGQDYATHMQGAEAVARKIDPFECLKGKKAVWVGDVNNVLNDLLVTLPRVGMEMAVAAPKGYDQIDDRVWQKIKEFGIEDKITLTNSPTEALQNADIVVTDTWISMGQEEEKAARLAAFSGYQVSESLCRDGGANPDWQFLHCLPRKAEEVDDEVFYGPRSHVFREAENRKWSMMSLLGNVFKRGRVPSSAEDAKRDQ